MHEIYKYKENLYLIFSKNGKIKTTEGWVDAIIYFRISDMNTLFCREKTDFENKFIHQP